jgi:4-hydroxyphenylpyruvate dioxygenase-like putative hemolysin
MSVDERIPEPTNPLGMDGVEFIEYATSQPQAFGALTQFYLGGVAFELVVSRPGP